MRKISMSLVVNLALLMSVQATETVRVVDDTYEDWIRGEPKGVTVLAEGLIKAGLRFELKTNLAALGAETIWAAMVDSKGAFYLGTGPQGKVFKLEPNGMLKELAKFKESQVYALTLGPDDTLYAATSPDGKVYRFSSDGKPQEFFNSKEKYVWALLWQGDGLYVATGNRGKLFHVMANGNSNLVYESEEPNLRCLALDKDGQLLIGTEGKGLILKLLKQGRALALYDAPRKEIRQIVIDEKGRIAFAALGDEAPPGKPKRSKPVPTVPAPSKQEGGEGSEEGGAPTPSPSPVSKGAGLSKGAKGDVYLLEHPGFARVLWSGDASPQSLLHHQGEWLIGTGDEGFLFGVNEREEERVIARAQGDQLTVLLEKDDEVFAAASNDTGWNRLMKGNEPGVFDSEVWDSGGFSRWGALRIRGNAAGIQTRSGNTLQPDKTWYDWQEVKNETIASPPARFLQYQIRLTTGAVSQVEFFYVPTNLPPQVRSIVVLPPGVGYSVILNPPPPPAQKTIQQLLAGFTGTEIAEGDKRLYPEIKNSMRTIVWAATDPNGDKLNYRLSYKREGEGGFTLFSTNQMDAVLSWDSAGWPEGRYVFKVAVTDEPNNPENPLADEMVSEPTLIDNTAPEIGQMERKQDTVIFSVKDSASLLTSAIVSKDGRNFIALLPEDGILDSRQETFRVKIRSSESVYVRIKDEAGNEASSYSLP